MRLENLEVVECNKGREEVAYLLSLETDIAALSKTDRKIILWGTAQKCFIAEQLLTERGLQIYGYCGNSTASIGKMLRGKRIHDPEEIFTHPNEYYVIITVSMFNEVRVQLFRHQIHNYSIFTILPTHSFFEEDPETQRTLDMALNFLFLEGESPKSALPLRSLPIESARDGEALGLINKPMADLRCSHLGLLWAVELIQQGKVKRILEIGPGFGLASMILLERFPNVSIDWILVGEQDERLPFGKQYEKQLKKVSDRYSARVRSACLYIEKQDIPFSDKYDLIYMTEVFEHFTLNPVRTLIKLRDALDTGGQIVISTPNWGHLYTYSTWKDIPDSDDVTLEEYLASFTGEHIYQYNQSEMDEIIAMAGLKVNKYDLSDGNNHNYLLER